MRRRRSPLDFLDSMVTESARRGVVHRTAEDDHLDGRHIQLDGRPLLNFSSCSYLGLELDPRLQEAAIEATRRFGTQFSSSRAYLSAPLYGRLEESLERVFEASVLVTPSTSLGHLAALPTLIERDHAVLLDHQVHHSVQMACEVARGSGATIDLLPHGDLDLLEERVHELAASHEKVWYLADGVYSMFGDIAPMGELVEILERHPSLHLYVDDAHGMSWAGPRGCGMVLSQVALHPRMVLATSLNKSFAASGGCLVFPDPDLRRRVLTVGGPMIFSGPVQPPMLGAALASAEIHLSGEIEVRQKELLRRIQLCTRLLQERGLPLVSDQETPIRFIGMGLPRAARTMAQRLMEEGCFTNLAHFPAVPMRQAGVRFTLTLHHRDEDIEALADALDRHFDGVLEDEEQAPEAPWKAFGLKPEPRKTVRVPQPAEKGAWTTQVLSSITQIPQETWDACLGDRGTFTWHGLRMLEEVFGGPAERPEDRWQFRYVLVRDGSDRVVAATFFTLALWKLDMLESEAVSREVERRRAADPYLLTAPVFAMGTLLTEGDHLYLDSARLPTGSPDWEKALSAILTAARDQAEALGSGMMVLRDLPAHAPRLEAFLLGQGFVRQDGPDRFVAETRSDDEAWLGGLSRRHRKFQRQEVQPWNDAYVVEVLDADSPPPSDALLAHLHGLYRNVRSRSLEINTFELPERLLGRIQREPGWEILLLRPREEPEALPVAMGAGFAGPSLYCPLVIGLDYEHVRDRGLYRQCLRSVFPRARHHGLGRVALGMGAGQQKRRFGAETVAGSVYVQADDHYGLDVLARIKADVGG
jgi:7-keto-8-aminopelargonate synthetase-like enzyme